MYNVFIQWKENTSNYKRFDGGLEVANKNPSHSILAANESAASWLYDGFNDYTFTGGGVLFNHNRQESAIEVCSNEPASYDFGDGTIYVAEVVE